MVSAEKDWAIWGAEDPVFGTEICNGSLAHGDCGILYMQVDRLVADREQEHQGACTCCCNSRRYCHLRCLCPFAALRGSIGGCGRNQKKSWTLNAGCHGWRPPGSKGNRRGTGRQPCAGNNSLSSHSCRQRQADRLQRTWWYQNEGNIIKNGTC